MNIPKMTKEEFADFMLANFDLTCKKESLLYSWVDNPTAHNYFVFTPLGWSGDRAVCKDVRNAKKYAKHFTSPGHGSKWAKVLNTKTLKVVHEEFLKNY